MCNHQAYIQLMCYKHILHVCFETFRLFYKMQIRAQDFKNYLYNVGFFILEKFFILRFASQQRKISNQRRQHQAKAGNFSWTSAISVQHRQFHLRRGFREQNRQYQRSTSSFSDNERGYHKNKVNFDALKDRDIKFWAIILNWLINFIMPRACTKDNKRIMHALTKTV